MPRQSRGFFFAAMLPETRPAPAGLLPESSLGKWGTSKYKNGQVGLPALAWMSHLKWRLGDESQIVAEPQSARGNGRFGSGDYSLDRAAGTAKPTYPWVSILVYRSLLALALLAIIMRPVRAGGTSKLCCARSVITS
jgi:hypothetical protein